jgi:hypothetical protein
MERKRIFRWKILATGKPAGEPKAYLNNILFDRDLVAYDFGFDHESEAAYEGEKVNNEALQSFKLLESCFKHPPQG